MKYYLIDGYNLAFRCFYAMPDLSRSDGFPTGALHAFFASLLKLSSSDTPHSTAVFSTGAVPSGISKFSRSTRRTVPKLPIISAGRFRR